MMMGDDGIGGCLGVEMSIFIGCFSWVNWGDLLC
jgi:hypothetical protein